MNLAIEPCNKTIEGGMAYARPEDRIEVNCPQCHNASWEIRDDVRKPLAGWSHLSCCKNCGFVTFNPQIKNIASWYLDEVRPQSIGFMRTKETKLKRHHNLIFKYLRDNNIEPNSVLDYGASDGYLLKEFRRIYPGIECKGIEINRGHANWAKYVDGLDVDTDASLNKLGDKRFDIVVLYHVLEHVQRPDIFISELKNKMSDSGVMYIALPTISRIDYANEIGLFKDEHINFWTDETLEIFLNLNGLEKVFFNNSQYGTCMIVKKADIKLKPEERIRYNSVNDLLNKINACMKTKEQIDNILKSGDRGKALAVAIEALKYFDEYPEMIIKTSQLYDPTDEIDFLEEWIKKKPHLLELQLQAGLSYYKEPNFEKAEYWLLKSVKNFGSPTVALAHLAFIEYKRGNIMQAVKYIERVLQQSPYDAGNFDIYCQMVAKL